MTAGLTDPFNLRANRGEAAVNIPIVSVTNFVYTTPQFGKTFIAKIALGGWEVSGIVTLQSGTPFSVFWTRNADYSKSHVNNDRADLTGLPLSVRQGGRSNWLNNYFDVGAFQQTAPGTFGNSPRNRMHGPGIATSDLGVSKNWQFERYRLQFRWEAFNAFNHTSFANPSGVIQNGGARIRSTGAIGPRLMQGALKLYF